MSLVTSPSPGTRVLLLNPPVADTLDAEAMDFITPVLPFGLLRLGRFFQTRSCEVRLLDGLRDPALGGTLRGRVRKSLPCGDPSEERTKEIHHFGLEPALLAERLKALPAPDVIATTSVFSWHVEPIIEALAVCREAYPKAHLVVGGNIPTLHPEAFAGSAADEVFVGDLVEASFLPPAIDLLAEPPEVDFLRMIKGCPHHCSYCVTNALNGGRVTTRPAEEVFEDLRASVARHGTKVFIFYDDFVLYQERRFLDPFLDRVIAQRPNVILEFPLGFSADRITEPLVRRLRQAGVETMILALETISEQASREMSRPHHLEAFMAAVELLKAQGYHGRRLRVFLLIGLPDQTLDEILRGILFLYHLGLAPSLTTYALTPGSADWQRFHHRVEATGLDDFTPGLWRFANPRMTSTDLDRLYRYFHERYFPLERIARSPTDDPLIRRMQQLITKRSYLPENWGEPAP